MTIAPLFLGPIFDLNGPGMSSTARITRVLLVTLLRWSYVSLREWLPSAMELTQWPLSSNFPVLTMTWVLCLAASMECLNRGSMRQQRLRFVPGKRFIEAKMHYVFTVLSLLPLGQLCLSENRALSTRVMHPEARLVCE